MEADTKQVKAKVEELEKSLLAQKKKVADVTRQKTVVQDQLTETTQVMAEEHKTICALSLVQCASGFKKGKKSRTGEAVLGGAVFRL